MGCCGGANNKASQGYMDDAPPGKIIAKKVQFDPETIDKNQDDAEFEAMMLENKTY